MAAAVEVDPSGAAIAFEGRTVSYHDLDAQSSRLARTLIDRGIGPEDLVAVGIPRSIESVTAVWAVAKAGAGFVPIDPNYPAERIAHMVADSGVKVGVTVGASRAAFADLIEWLVVDDPEFATTVAAQSPEPVSYADRVRPLRIENPAYVIYTSGSTGKPKGVVLSHSGLANICENQRSRFHIDAQSRTLHFASPSFDASVFELLFALSAGATMVIVPREIYGGVELNELMRRERVTHAFVTPSALASVDPDGLDQLRSVMVGGEACPPELVARWAVPLRAGGVRNFFNGYGPTETTMMSNMSALTPGAPITIGPAIPRMTAYILDGRLAQTPDGVVGEMYLAGIALARGYSGRPGLTADRFVANPFDPDGSRLYRTGDLVRARNGDIEYVGRNDFQVKIRGFRIELGEIDAALTAHPDVEFVVTMGRESVPGTTVLVSYVLPRLLDCARVRIDADAMVEFAARSLPAHMVPSAVVVIDEIPLTPVGKLDRAALPEPVTVVREYRAPSTPLEEIVADVFAQVLSLEQVGRDDDFFELGGNSLIATQVAARLSAALDARLPARVVFGASTVADLALAIEPQKGQGGAPALGPRFRPELIPLSFAQQRMWFLNRFDTASAANNIPFALRLTGELDSAALRTALADVIERHETLRTRYPEVDGVGYQEILPAAQAIPNIEPITVAESELVPWVSNFAMHGFDVAAQIPLRAALLRVSPTEHVLAIVVHHITADGGSIAPMVRDVVTSYVSRAAGNAPEWAPLSVQYADYTLWQRDVLGDENEPESLAAQQIEHWRTNLAGLPDRIDLPADRPRPAQPSSIGANHEFDFGTDLYARLDEIARANDVSLFMVVHAAFAVLVARLTGTSDVAIGAPIAGRGDAALDDLIGMFVNTLVLRSSVDVDAPFTDLLQQVRENDLDAFSNADLPFERLVEILDPVRSNSHHPLFQIALFFQNISRPELELPGLAVSGVDFEGAIAKFDLQLTVSTVGTGDSTGLRGNFTYATDLFDEATVDGFAQRLVRLLTAIADDPTATIGEIDLLSPQERSQIVDGRNATTRTVGDSGLLDAYERQVVATPNATAVVYGGEQLTYGQFDARVNRLARKLIADGVGPETLVALAMRRSIDLVVGMYAVVRAGGAYVPLDPDHPADRIAHILDTARPLCVLTTSRDDFTAADGVPTFAIDTMDLAQFADSVVADVERLGEVQPSNPAYVIFTSGSTGRPKGVAVTHEAIANQLEWMREEYALDATDIYLQKTATTFDVSLWGYFLPLQVGATLVIAIPDGHRDPGYVAETIAAHGVTVTDFVPSMLTVFAAHVDAEAIRSLRHVFVIGEALPPQTVADFQARSSAGVHNLYGPTEAAVSVTYWPADATGDSVPIGLPEANVAVYVLDSHLRPVPDGVPGELYLAGVQLARGYVARPDLCADRFVANPFGAPGERMYRTGDLVRWGTRPGVGADGAPDHPARTDVLIYIGRTDFQVKFRGQRIELGEIETALLAQNGVSQAVALVVPTGTGDQLVGYVVASPGVALRPADVTDGLDELLPAYMIPAAVLVLDEFPLNTSGKLDRKALPAPVFEVSEFRAPTTPIEEIVANVFGDVLGAPRVGSDDDFFALGGNSLIATQVASRIGAALDTRVPVRALFETPTVSALAAHLESHTGAETGRVPLVARDRPERIPLSLAQQRMWFLNRFEPESAASNLPFAIRLSGSLDGAALATAVIDVVRRHESLRTMYPEHDGVAHQLIVPVADAVPDLTPVPVTADAVTVAITDFVTQTFDVTQQVPLRARLLQVAPDEHVLAVVLHHISGDGFSIGPLTRDVMVAYAARVHWNAPAWSPLPVQYADYALWQRDALGSLDDPESVISKQADFWRTRLSGLPDQLDLPSDRARPAVASHRGADFAFDIEARVHRGLDGIAREKYATTFMAVHAALAILLARLSGTDDIAIGTPVAGRGEEALDDVIGMFVNTLVLRTEVDPAASFVDLLERTRAADLGAFGHADVPFERLVELLNPERSQARHPLFQVMLTFQNMAQTSLELPGLSVSAADFDMNIAKFDLQLTLAERFDDNGRPDGMRGVFTYATDLFDEATISGFATRLGRILDAVVDSPTAAVGAADILDADERARVLHSWNEAGDQPDDTLVHLFGLQAAQTPDAVAVVYDGDSLTYAELAARARRLARQLIEAGVGPESLVAVALPRSLDLVVALLAVLEAGGAYLPVDVTYPADRLAFMLTDAAPVCVLVAGDSLGDLAIGDLPVIDLSAVDLAGYDHTAVTDAERRGALRGDNAAYVIYTSGSTGVPKGVLVPHRNVARLFANTQGRFSTEGHRGFDSSDVWTMFHSYSFDFSVWELWGPLLHGGKLVVVDYFTSRSPEQFRELLVREQVTVLNQTPSAFYQLVEADRTAGGADLSLRYVIFGGEALDFRQLNRWYDRHPDSPQLVNMYGITETTVHVSHHELTAESARTESASVIGRAIPGLGTYVLDTRLAPVPVGVPGEIYVYGGQLARGYLGRAALSAGRFVADPFGAPGAQMYRTGDIARWNREGQLEYAGRSDSQVQLRGFRIELGEIESALLRFESVAQATAIVRADDVTGDRLIGYVVPETGATVEPAALTEFVAETLTAYMVPDAIVVLDALPLTANGKLDRKALPAPRYVTDKPFLAPRTPMEQTIAEVFADVLGAERVGIDDSFFALGGDSIVSIQLVSRAKARGVRFTPRDVFERKSVAGLAEVAVLDDGAADIAVLAELPGGGVGDLPLTPVVRYMVERGGSFGRYNQSIALELPVGIDRAGIVATLTAVIDRHDMLRARLRHDDIDGWQLETAAVGSVDVDSLIDRIEFDAEIEEVAPIAAPALDEALGKLDPATGSVLRFVWLDPVAAAGSTTRAGRLIVAAHHVVVDGVSWRIIVPDLVAAWAQLAAGAEPVLAATTTSMRRWAHALADVATDERLLAELPWWTAAVDGPDPALGERAFDPTRDLATTVRKVRIELSESVTESLLTTVPRVFHSGVNDALLTALTMAVRSWRAARGTDEPTALIRLEGHGREEDTVPGADLTRTVGWFTTIYPVRTDLRAIDIDDAFAGGPAAGAAIKAVKEQLHAVPNKGIGYGLLRYLGGEPAAQLRGAGIGQISFNYLGKIFAGDIPDGFADVGWIPAGDVGDLSGTADADTPAQATVDINAVVLGGRLGADIGYASDLLAEADARELADLWRDALIALAEHAERDGAGGHTPSDFGLVSVGQRDIDAWETRYPAMTDVWPLAPLQNGLAFHAMLAAGSVDVYTAQVVLQLEGAVDARRLRAAGQAVLERYPNLRTGFVTAADGTAVQVVDDRASLPWREVDLSGAADADAALTELTAAERAERFDLAAPPLLRFTLVSMGDNRFRLVVTNHHILLDGWSMPLLMKDLLVLYAVRSDSSVLPPVRSYRAFLEWVTQQDTSVSARAWRSALAGVAEPSLLAQADPSRQITSLSGEYRFELDEETTAALVAFAARVGVTPNTVVQTAWGILLGRSVGRDDVVFGTTVSGRPPHLAGVESMVGLFINTVPVRVRVDASESIETLLSTVQAEQADLLAHHYIGLADIASVGGPGAVFDTLFVFESYPVDANGISESATDIDGMSVAGIDVADATHYPLTLIAHMAARLSVRAAYLRDLFDEATVRTIADRYVRVLTTMIADPTSAVGDIDLLDDAERAKVLTAWNEPADAAPDMSLVELFEEQAARTPDAIAVVFGESRVTYRDLDQRATKIARHLVTLGAGPDTLVGVAMGRSEALIAAMIAVVKAGAAYVPIDPNYPAERIAYTLADARPICVLADTADSVVVPDSVAVVALDTLDLSAYSVASVQDSERTEPLRTDQGAYVIYTSGSTGRPKGVQVTHRNVVELMTNAVPKFGFDGTDVWTFFHSSAFDFSVWEMWGPLLTGGSLVVTDYLISRSPAEFVELVRAEGVTVLNQTPSAFYQFAEAERVASKTAEAAGEALAPLSLRHVIFGGEALDPGRLTPWFERHGDTSPRLVNMYGITETTVHVSFLALDATTVGAASVIGRGLPGLAVYVLDSRLRPVPVGMPGEMYVTGRQLSRGYLNRPDLTSARFVAAPFGPPGTTMYRTGDVATWNTDGLLEYAGRSDSQVQLRGFRIELGEIESALGAYPGVAHSVALVRSDAATGDRLVGYVVGEHGASVDPAAVTQYVSGFLTSYMVPDVVVVIDELPLTPNGKLDRAALPAPEFVSRAEFRAPRTQVETVVADVFADVLGIERVGLDDDFFELGGNSLTAARAVARLKEETGADVRLQWLFEHRSVGALAGRVDSGESAAQSVAGLEVVLPIRAGTGDALFCVHPMSGLAWDYLGLAEYAGGRPVYGVQSPAILEPDWNPTSIAAIAARYVDEIRRVQPVGPYQLLGWSLGGVLAHAIAVALQNAGEAVAQLVLVDSVTRIDLGQFVAEMSDALRAAGIEVGSADELADFSPEQSQALAHAVGAEEAGLDAAAVHRMVAAAVRAPELINGYQPGTYRGDVLFFSAAVEHPTSADAADTWQPYVTGAIENHTVSIGHGEMMKATSLAVLGPVVERVLPRR